MSRSFTMALLFLLLLSTTSSTPININIKPGQSTKSCTDSSQHNPTNCILSDGIHYTSINNQQSKHHLQITGTNNTILTGLTPLIGNTWNVYKDQIYSTKIPTHLINTEQIFMDNDVFLSPARYPNLKNGGINGVLDLFSWAFCGKGSHVGTCVDRKDRWSDLSKFNTSMKGALATLSLGGRYATYTRKIKTHRAGSARFTYNKNLGPGPGSKNTGVGNRYWLSGKLELLDSPGEWYIDTNTSMIYVWMPDNSNPNDRLSFKTNDYCVDHQSSKQENSGITISNVTFLACTFRLRGCNASAGIPCIVQDVNLTYPSYHREIHLRDPVAPFSLGPPPNITLIVGDGAVVERLSIRWSNSAGIKIVGSHNILNELLVQDTDWLATLDYPPVEIGFDVDKKTRIGYDMYPRNPFGINNTISYSTVRGFGNAGVVTSQLSNQIHHCHVHQGGLLGSDDACVHADNSASRCGRGNTSTVRCGKHWHHNWVHNCLAKCMRGDDNTQNLTMSNNVIFNCGLPNSDGSGQSFGVVLKGDGNAFFSNTIFSTKETAVEFATGAELKFHLKQSNANSILFNNVAHTWSGHHGPDPLEKKAHFKFGPKGQYTSGAIKKTYFTDMKNMDFTPIVGAPFRGIGVAHAPFLLPPAIGQPPLDAGAYQTGDVPWRAGCTFDPSC